MDNSKIHEALMAVQSELKAPKGQMNKFGGYKYRSCEDILEAVKPILKAHSLVLRLSDICFSFFSMTNISYMEKINRQHLYLEKERITFILLKNKILDYQLS